MSNNDRPLYGLIDLGGTKLLSLIVNAPGDIIGEDLRPSNTEEGLDSTVQRIGLSLDSALAGAGFGREQLRSVGVASPGAINFEAGVVSEAPQLPGWQDVPLRDILRELLGLEVMLENDANAAAVGEHVYGAGRGSRHMLYLTISTGIGGGIIIDGRLYRGKSGAAGELGHIVLDMNGPLCGCGARGCVESLASGTAIAREAQQLIAAGQAPVLSRLAQEEGEVTAETVYKAALEGEEISGRLLKQAGVYLGTALASYLSIFEPDTIVLGGGVMNVGDWILVPARETMQSLARPIALKGLRLLTAELGNRSGALGMLALLKETFR